MYKFLKSKRGFTLVELMIVVVIMAILVAVAVPIYSAVTANAKKKTCIANQRELVAQLNNYGMSNFDKPMNTGTITIKTNADGDGYDAATLDCGGVFDDDGETLTGMFQTMPYCPIAGNTIRIFVEKEVAEGEYFIRSECYDADNDVTDHKYNPDET